MNFLKSITAAALLATAISSTNVIAAGALDAADDLKAFQPKVGLAIGSTASKVKGGTITITDDLVDKAAALKTFASTHATPDVAEVINKLAHSLSYVVEEIAKAVDANDVKAAIAQYKTDNSGADLVIKLQDTFALSFDEAKMKLSIDKSLQDFFATLNTETPTEKDLNDLARMSSQGDQKELNGTILNGSKGKVKLADLIAEYGKADKTQKGLLDTLVKALKTESGEDFDDAMTAVRAKYAHVVVGKEAAHHAAKKAAFQEGVKSAKATPEQVAGEAVLGGLTGMISAGLIEFDDTLDLTDATHYTALVKKLKATLALVDGLQQDVADLTDERDAALSKAATGTGKGIASLGGGGSKPAAPKGKDVTASHATKYASAEALGHGDNYLATHKLTKHGDKLYS